MAFLACQAGARAADRSGEAVLTNVARNATPLSWGTKSVARHPDYFLALATATSLKGFELIKRILLLSLSLIFLLSVSVFAQDNPDLAAQAKPATTDEKPEAAVSEQAQAEALQKATQNPVANLISVPLQNNTNLNYGPYNRTQDVLNIQPVIPAHLSKKWLLISRIILPIVWQPYPNQNTGGEYGLGDMNPSFFLSPAKPGKVIWGVGPAFVIPTRHQHHYGARQAQHGTFRGRSGPAPALDDWRTGQ